MNGAEKLLGKGDMLFYPSGYQKPIRVQGAFVSDEEVSKVVEFLREENNAEDSYGADIQEKIQTAAVKAATSQERDEYFEKAAEFIIDKDKASIASLQRVFKIGFNRAARHDFIRVAGTFEQTTQNRVDFYVLQIKRDAFDLLQFPAVIQETDAGKPFNLLDAAFQIGIFHPETGNALGTDFREHIKMTDQ